MGDGTSVYNMYQVDDAGVWELDIQNTHTHTHLQSGSLCVSPKKAQQRRQSQKNRVSLRCCSGYL